MFGKIFALFALIAVAFAAPKAEPEPKPQYLTSDLGYISPYSAGVLPSYLSPYGAVGAVPFPYFAPGVEYFVRK